MEDLFVIVMSLSSQPASPLLHYAHICKMMSVGGCRGLHICEVQNLTRLWPARNTFPEKSKPRYSQLTAGHI